MISDHPAIETYELTKQYGECLALDRLTLAVYPGQILGFIGPNGAGKTTTIKILAGLARPTRGWARIAGADCVRDSRKIKRLVGYMPDMFGSYDNMRVREYLDFFGAAFGISRRARNYRIDEVLDITNARDLQDKYVESLSHGMQQRIGIARTLLHDPPVLICDEPANGLDPQARIEMRELLLHLVAGGKTIIVTSHILPELSRICDHVAIIIHGRLRAFGTLDDIMRKVRQRRTIEVQLAGSEDVSHAETTLQSILQPEEPVYASSAEGIVRFETRREESALHEVLARLLQGQVHVTQFRELPADLEDAFLSVTREDESSELPWPADPPADTAASSNETL